MNSLYNVDVALNDLENSYVIKKVAGTNVVNGRQVKTYTDVVIKAHIQNATESDLRAISDNRINLNHVIKIFTKNTIDIKNNDFIVFRDKNYRILKLNVKTEGNFNKYFGELDDTVLN